MVRTVVKYCEYEEYVRDVNVPVVIRLHRVYST